MGKSEGTSLARMNLCYVLKQMPAYFKAKCRFLIVVLILAFSELS